MDKIYSPLLDPQEIKPLLSSVSIFGGLKGPQLDEILGLLKTVTYENGDYIFKRGEKLSYIYIIKQGKVRMKIEEKGLALDLITLKKGDCFGETSVIGIQTHSANALVLELTELIVLEPSKLLSIYETNKEIFSMLILNIARETARRLNQSNEALVQYMQIKDMNMD